MTPVSALPGCRSALICVCPRLSSCERSPPSLRGSYPTHSLPVSPPVCGQVTGTCAPPRPRLFRGASREKCHGISACRSCCECHNSDGTTAASRCLSLCLCGCVGLVCLCVGARWTLSSVHECGLFCRLHLGLHMVQQTAVREAGGCERRAPLRRAASHLRPASGHRRKWHSQRLPDRPGRGVLL